MLAFCDDLNRAIMLLAPPHEVRSVAPQTWRDIQASAKENGRIVVWSGEAQHSIYGDAQVNYAFRAWHDHCHLVNGYEFTIAGETAAVDAQCAMLRHAFPGAPSLWSQLLRADVLGVVYTLHAGLGYIADQRASVKAILALPGGLDSLKPARELARYAYGRG